MKLTDLRAYDIIQADVHFTCMSAGFKTIQANDHGELYVQCDEGRHYLNGQTDSRGELVGFSRATFLATE